MREEASGRGEASVIEMRQCAVLHRRWQAYQEAVPEEQATCSRLTIRCSYGGKESSRPAAIPESNQSALIFFSAIRSLLAAIAAHLCPAAERDD